MNTLTINLIDEFFPKTRCQFSSKNGGLFYEGWTCECPTYEQRISTETHDNIFISMVNNINKNFSDIHSKFSGAKTVNNLYNGVGPETLTDIYFNRLAPIQKDMSTHSVNKVFGFGYVGKGHQLKPQRKLFQDMCEKDERLEFLSTGRLYEQKTKKISFNDAKRYKYLIDLEGHNYSTKNYPFLFSRRVFFWSESFYFPWEDMLKPYKNYIPIKRDLSDLIDKIHLVENNPSLYQEIVDNNQNLCSTVLSPAHLFRFFEYFILSHFYHTRK